MRPTISILLLCLLTLATPMSIQAADLSASQLSYTDLLKLSQCEQLWFGSAHKNLPALERIETLELAVFGHNHGGTDSSRIAALGALLKSSQGNLLMPPEAPKLDKTRLDHEDLPGSAGLPVPQAAAAASIRPAPSMASDRTKSMLHDALKLYSQGDAQAAKAAFERVLVIDPKNADAYFNLGAIAEGQGDLHTALDEYQRASYSSPDDSEIRSAITSVQGKLTSSQAKNGRAKQNEPDDKQWQSLKEKVDRAAVAYKTGKYDQAIELLQSVEKETPDRADVLYALSQAYKAKGRLVEAQTALNQALTIDPGNQTYQQALANLNRQIANGQSSKHSIGNGYDTLASAGNSDTTLNTNQTPGQITPFSSAGAPVGWQSGGDYYSSGTPGYYPAYAYRAHSSGMGKIQRVAIGSVAGASFGAMLGGGYRGGRMQGALVGGLAGGLFGLLSGH